MTGAPHRRARDGRGDFLLSEMLLACDSSIVVHDVARHKEG